MDYKDFFSFTKQERRGIVVFLISVTSIVFIGKIWQRKSALPPEILYDYYFGPDSTAKDENQIDEQTDTYLWDNTDSKSNVLPKQKFSFDPNVVSLDSLLMLGFSKYGAKSLLNYRSKGGRIYNDDKFKSIYGIDSNIINSLRQFIYYPQKKLYLPFKNEDVANILKPKEENIFQIFDLNSADSSQLVTIKGIGPFTAAKIINFRKRIGGFLLKEQLVELNIIKDSLFREISPQLKTNPELIKKININAADYKSLVTHPYFSSETANAILKYRKQHGNFTETKHISRIRSIREETGMKIMPYLSVE